MEKKRDRENERANRIALRIGGHHLLLANIYENLVDRDFKEADRDLREIIFDLKLILKSIEEDDF
jgi:hypothetical protein